MSDTTAAAPGYTPIARLLHWLIAALVLLMIPLGFVIANEWGGPAQQFLYNLHKSIGATLIPLVVIRMLYRLTHPAPPLPSDIPAIQRFAAHATHWALYVLILVQPIVGYIMTSAYPAPVPFFGLFNLPAIWPQDRALSEAACRSCTCNIGILPSRWSRRCTSAPHSTTTSCARIDS